MKTRPKAKTRVQKTDASSGVSESTTLSVRLTAQERGILAEAAALRGWTPTNLLRVAALERAAQILNTSRPTKLPLARLAAQVAESLCGQRKFWKQYEDDEAAQEFDLRDLVTELGGSEDGWRFWCEPSPFSEDEMRSLRDAVRLGGPDFLALVLAECARLQKPVDPAQQLPDPIDPNSFS